jgi:hypothetical protein
MQLNDLIEEIKNDDRTDADRMQDQQDRLLMFHHAMRNDPTVAAEDVEMVANAIRMLEWHLIRMMKERIDVWVDWKTAADIKAWEARILAAKLRPIFEDDSLSVEI